MDGLEVLEKCENELSTLWLNDESGMREKNVRLPSPANIGVFFVPFENVTLPFCLLLFMGCFKPGLNVAYMSHWFCATDTTCSISRGQLSVEDGISGLYAPARTTQMQTCSQQRGTALAVLCEQSFI